MNFYSTAFAPRGNFYKSNELLLYSYSSLLYCQTLFVLWSLLFGLWSLIFGFCPLIFDLCSLNFGLLSMLTDFWFLAYIFLSSKSAFWFSWGQLFRLSSMVQRYGDISRLQSPQCGQTPGPQPLIISTLANSHTDNAQKLTPILMYGPRNFLTGSLPAGSLYTRYTSPVQTAVFHLLRTPERLFLYGLPAGGIVTLEW